MTAAPNTLVLIDGHALAFRSLFALRRGEPHVPRLTNSRGEATDAIQGFLSLTLRLCKQRSNQVIVVFDPPVKTFRHEQFEGYKAGRADAPSDLHGQVDRIREIVDALGIPRFEEPGYEADDVIASLTRMAEGTGMQVRIVTSDRDSYQLLDDHVRVIANDFSLIGPAEVLEKYGVTVRQWVDFRALTGDASDNIPGAKGIGPKTAAKLLQEYGTLEKMYEAARAGTLKPDGVRQKLLDSEEAVQFSHQLSCMVTDLPLDVKLGTGRGEGDPNRLQELLTELELHSIRKQVIGLNAAENAAGSAADGDLPDSVLDAQAQAEGHGQVAALPPFAQEPWQTPGQDVVWGYVLSREDDLTAALTEAATFQAGVTRLAPVTEPEEWKTAEAHAPVSLFGDKQPTTKKQQKELEKAQKEAEKRLAKLRTEHPATVNEEEFVGQRTVTAAGAKALAAHLSVRGTSVEPGDDPLLYAYLLDPANMNMPLTVKRYLDTEWPADAASRAAISAHLLRELPALLDEKRLDLYENMEKPLSVVLKRMEVRGVRLDSDFLQTMNVQAGATLPDWNARFTTWPGKNSRFAAPSNLKWCCTTNWAWPAARRPN